MCNGEAWSRYTSTDKETQNDHKSQKQAPELTRSRAGIYRICTPLDVIPGGFTFNSYLIADDEPLLFHTGYRKTVRRSPWKPSGK